MELGSHELNKIMNYIRGYNLKAVSWNKKMTNIGHVNANINKNKIYKCSDNISSTIFVYMVEINLSGYGQLGTVLFPLFF